ncbi:DUF2927 domain-containing protein [Octadecabacter sp. 1_MG-2023]|uniref:DUF2927 domain-containing protein n=1 Tax=unclassified Octadecabacter TaxID=196158 RepID=UPI001C08B845|nr:DUF2927 domain-containing protein [Octadecabacter sp. 1_MG-2023]MBU2992037.1 DUF2927 domain-containing protein [Octadecabacter sp. B2R22]MDO6736012.1 DUF2927 domain-containing protein [Octadecabacter sp. 1_MG-2023]
MICRILAWIGVAVFTAPVFAQEYVTTDGPLSDTDFYRLVSCAARPGEGCNEPIIHWGHRVVTVTFAPIPIGYSTELAREMDRALGAAVAQINGAVSGITVRRVSKSQPADIVIYLQPIRAGDVVRGTGYSQLDGTQIGAALVQVFWDENLKLTEAAIVFAGDLPIDQAGSVMVEELSQAMGLMTDIRNPHYNTLSVFSEDSNSVAKLGRQDREALRRHYPNTP